MPFQLFQLNGTIKLRSYKERKISMARVCDICDKRRQVGNSVSHANNRTKRVFQPNLQTVRALVGKSVKRLRVCTSCIKSGKVVKAG